MLSLKLFLSNFCRSVCLPVSISTVVSVCAIDAAAVSHCNFSCFLLFLFLILPFLHLVLLAASRVSYQRTRNRLHNHYVRLGSVTVGQTCFRDLSWLFTSALSVKSTQCMFAVSSVLSAVGR